MRNSPIIANRKCCLCGEEYSPTGNSQLYCPTCRKVKRTETRKKYESKKHPNRKPKTKCSEPCCVCGSEFSSHYNNMPYCNKHYQSMIRYGQPYGHTRERTNTYEVDGDVLIVTTASGETILADADDYDIIRKHSWCVSATGYAVANVGGSVVKMHRYLLESIVLNQVVDHKNHNKLDNRKANLRICTPQQNSKNRGANFGNENVGIRLLDTGKYNVRITNDRKDIHVGNYGTLEEAREARIAAERKYHGEYGYHDSIGNQ